jgi:hypothetical protein
VKVVQDCVELTDGCLLGIMMDNDSTYYSMIHEQQSTLEASPIECPGLRNRIPCMAHDIQLAIGTFMRSLGVKDRTKSCEAHEHNQQCRENESIHIRKNQRNRKEGNTIMNKVLAIKRGLAKIIEKLRIS